MNATQRAIQLDAEGKCIICLEPREKRRRGLCVKHYEQFRRKRESLSGEKAAEWEEIVVQAGRLLPSKQGRRAAAEDDAFADLFAAFQEGRVPLGPDGADPELLNTLNKEAEKFQRSRAAKKAPKKAPRKRSQG